MADLQKKLGSSPTPQPGRSSETPRAIWSERDRRRKNQRGLKFLSYFWGPIPWMIESRRDPLRRCPSLARFLRDSCAALSNALVGFWEEHQAGNAIAALKARLAIKAKVSEMASGPIRRQVTWCRDVIRLRLGDIIPADARLLAGDPVEVDQSALTENPCPSPSNPAARCFRVRFSVRARSTVWCNATGTNTYFGKTAQLVQEAHTRQPFPARRIENRRLPDCPRGGAGRRDSRRRTNPRRQGPHHARILPRASGAAIPVAHAHRAVGDHGPWAHGYWQRRKRL